MSMQPFYFGLSEQPLFGMYHAPDGPAKRRAPVVLCHPTGHEYLRAHRAFRNLATTLAGQGLHVLRFDYLGMGDSAGEGELTTVGQCLDDIATAIEELKDISGSPKVTLVGLRIGATLASVAASRRTDVDRVCLWDPVVDGRDYLSQITLAQRLWLKDRMGEAVLLEDERSQCIGFPMTDAIRHGLETMRMPAAETIRCRTVSLFVSEDDERYRTLHGALTAAGNAGGYALVAGSGDWADGEQVHQLLLAHAMVRSISAELAA
jgi:pimeloyl-ACP methyl ester carboxylesterase